VYTETIEAPHTRVAVTLDVEMTNEVGQAFFDSVSVNFNMNFARILKVTEVILPSNTLQWILALPFVLMAFILVFVKELRTPLPLSI
jgi:hypothetical protein